MRALLRACGAVSGFVIAFTLMQELSRERVWYEDEQRNFQIFAVLPITLAMAAAVGEVGRRLTSRPAWLAPTVLGLASLTLAVSAAWGIRAASDRAAIGMWGAAGDPELARAWETDYASRYWNAAVASARQEAWVQQSVAAVSDVALPPEIEALRRAHDPRRFQPTRPPDTATWDVRRLRTGPFSSGDTYVLHLTARWHDVPLEMPTFAGVPVLERRTVEVREVLQYLGPAHEPRDGGWRLVRSEAEIR